MNITPEQAALRDRIAGLRESLNEIQKLLWAAEKECREHVYAAYSDYAAAVCCVICGKHGGWYCPESPSHACEYDWKTHSENCIHCGEPQERK